MKLDFAAWMNAVDSIISARFMGLTTADLPDCCYGDWYDEGLSPRSAAARAVRMAKE